MEYDRQEIMPIPFSSFLAGVLLLDKSIKMSQLSKYMCDFSIKYAYISDYRRDVDELTPFVDISDGYLYLKFDYNFEIVNGDDVVTLYDYLYNLTTSEIRDYFDIPERENITIYRPNIGFNNKVKKKSLFLRFKRTKVYM